MLDTVKGALIIALEDMAENGVDSEYVIDSIFGICNNLDRLYMKLTDENNCVVYNLVTKHGKCWEHYSGYESYPVPNDYGGRLSDLWSNPKRLELCTYLADKLELELKGER